MSYRVTSSIRIKLHKCQIAMHSTLKTMEVNSKLGLLASATVMRLSFEKFWPNCLTSMGNSRGVCPASLIQLG